MCLRVTFLQKPFISRSLYAPAQCSGDGACHHEPERATHPRKFRFGQEAVQNLRSGCARRLHLNLFANCRKLYFPDVSSARKHRRTRTCIIILCKTANAPRAASSASWCPCRRCRRSHRPLAGALAVVSPRISVARLPVAVKLLELSAQTALGQTPRSQRAQGLHTRPQGSVLLGALLLMCSTRIESNSRGRGQNCR